MIMKKSFLQLFFVILSVGCCNISIAQIVGTDVFLQGHWLEIGVDQMGAFGTCTSPATYHAHNCYCTTTCATVGAELDASYDWGHDGWTTGSPCFMGDYTIPGFPQEGWSIQVGATEYRNWATGGACSGSFMVPGGITGYSNVGGVARGTFTGNVAGLHIVQESRVDTDASWVVVTTRIYNTTGATISGIYYERTCDPDNASMWNGGSNTTNVIVHQNEDARHDVMVATYSTATTFSAPAITFNRYNTYMALATKDCRAKCFYFTGFDLAPAYTPSVIWGGGSPYISALGDSANNDVGIALVYNLGNLTAAGTPGDSAVISYAYVYNNNGGIDGALPDPQVVVAGDTAANSPAPYPSYDTFNVCSLPPGTVLVPITMAFSTDKDWTWSSWTWAPSTGLSSTTGSSVILDVTALSGPTTFTITGTDSSVGMNDCNHRVYYLTILPCHTAYNNGPCEGDTLKLVDLGDSTGATYAWTGPLGFTSTKQHPFIYPCILADSGMYHVIKTIGSAHDTDSTHVTIHPRPHTTATNNSPLCAGLVDTLDLYANPDSAGEVFSWTGPGGFSSGLQDPVIVGTAPPGIPPPAMIGIGVYTVVATTSFGCKDTAYTLVDTIARPHAPIITDPTPYCQNETFIPFTVSGLEPGAVVWWYPGSSGGVGTTVPSVVNTAIPGNTTVWATQKVGSCESPRGSFTVHVITTPPPPVVSGITQYCQFVGPVDSLLATHTATGVLRWYTVAVGGVFTYAQPIPNINVVPAGGAYHYWVSQIDSTCESPRTEVIITIHPKPAPPVISPQWWCQLRTPLQVSATPSGAGDVLLWYGPGVTVGSTTAPTPSTAIAPDTIVYYVTETSSFNCVSDSAIDRVVIKAKPVPPVTAPIKYCQFAPTVPLSGQVDSGSDSHLNWYYNAGSVPAPVYPFTDTTPGNYTWWVSQTVPNVQGCESDSASLTVTIIYKPVFGIGAIQPWVCQHDSITMWYSGPSLYAPGYAWTLPAGAYFADRTHSNDSLVIVKFDTATLNNYVHLTTSDDSGFCRSDTSIRIKIIKQPTAQSSIKADICLGDTVTLGLANESMDAYTYLWYIDSVLMSNSVAINIIASNSNSGGPFSVSWVDSGRHIIVVKSFSQEGCKSEPSYDTINVHTIPDATFKFSGKNGVTCLEDSVLFTANTKDYNNAYNWQPAHSFDNENTPVIWGRVEQLRSIITLTVTDPFGCVATESREIDPQTCCTVWFPNAFTPNGDKLNDEFEPKCTGYHLFHMFRIVNRWGQTVYESTNSKDAKWDGNYNGVPQDMGTYFYYLKYDCGGNTLEQKGDVTLIR